MTYEYDIKNNNDFVWLMYWFWAQSNDDWEHCYGVSLETVDRDTWILNIKTLETELMGRKSPFSSTEDSENEILFESTCRTIFQNLKTFRNFAEPYSKINHIVNKLSLNDEPFVRLIQWYEKACRNKNYKIKVNTLDNPGWMLEITLNHSKKENLDKISYSHSENDWVFGKFDDGIFSIACGPFNLLEAINIFLNISAKDESFILKD